MVELNIVNFITIGLIAMLFAWIFNMWIKPIVSKVVPV